MDTISKEKRSHNMSRIKSEKTKPEIIVRSIMREADVHYRCNAKTLPGKPDISVKKYRLALDVHGCFWHGHANCKNFRIPKSNEAFWINKITRNVARDAENARQFRALGFDYFEIWECQLEKGELGTLERFIALYHQRRNSD